MFLQEKEEEEEEEDEEEEEAEEEEETQEEKQEQQEENKDDQNESQDEFLSPDCPLNKNTLKNFIFEDLKVQHLQPKRIGEGCSLSSRANHVPCS